jgi:DNA-binding MarR family transcriptional regulator
MTLARLTSLVSEVFDRGVRHPGLSATGRQALAVLDGAGEPLSPTEIAERLLLTTASITSLLYTLERRGWIRRQSDPRDRRKQLISLTGEGQRLVDDMLPRIVALQAAIMEHVSENDRRHLLRTLDIIRATAGQLDAEDVAAAAPPRGKRKRT